MKVVLALDEFQHSEAAVRSVCKRAWPSGTEIVLLSVIDLGLYDQEGWNTETMIDMNQVNKFLVARRNQYLDLHGETLRRAIPKLKIKKTVLQGRAREGILKAVRLEKPDLLIMGTHGHKGAKKLILGSVAEAVLVEALCPCEVVKEASYEIKTESIEKSVNSDEVNKDTPFRVLVCVQDNKCINFLSDFIFDFPLPQNVEFMLVHTAVTMANFNFLDLDGATESLQAQISSERWRLGKKYLQTMSKKLGLVSNFDKIQESVEEGDPRNVIDKKIEEWKPNLVILGSHGKKGIMSLGSVSRHILAIADCSVIIVPLLDAKEKERWLNQERKLHIIV